MLDYRLLVRLPVRFVREEHAHESQSQRVKVAADRVGRRVVRRHRAEKSRVILRVVELGAGTRVGH